MRTKQFIAAAGGIVIIFIFPFLSIAQDTSESANNDLLLSRMEENIAFRRSQIADYYDRRMDTLERRAERELRGFEKAQFAKLYETALDWYDYRYLPIGYVMAEYGRMISLDDIAHSEHRIEVRGEQIALKLERAIALIERQKDYALNVMLANEKARLIEALD